MRRHGAGFALWPMALMTTMIVVVWGTDAIACSGPRTAEIIHRSQQIAWSLAGLSFVLIAAGTIPLAVQGKVGTFIALWCLAAVHPGLWMSVVSGDCGFGARFYSILMTVLNGLTLATAIIWPPSVDGNARKLRGRISGGLAGAIAGILFVLLQLSADGPLSADTDTMLVAGWSICSMIAAGILCGAWLCSERERPWYRPRFRVRTLILLPALVAPFLVVLLPVRHYEESFSTIDCFYFLVVDQETRRPVSNATVRLIDPRYRADGQMKDVVTAADGIAEFSLRARVTGRAGLLFRTENTSYYPQVVRVEAPNYEPFLAPLSDDASTLAGAYTDRRLALEFPPPQWAVISLRRKLAAETPRSDPGPSQSGSKP